MKKFEKIIKNPADIISLVCLTIAFFFISIKASVVNTFILLALISFLFSKESLSRTRHAFTLPLTKLFTLFFFLAALSLLWSENIQTGIDWLQKYALYLFFPILLAMLRTEWTKVLLTSFLTGIFISEIISYGIWLQIMESPMNNKDHTAFIDHIRYSPMIALISYLLFYQLITSWKSLQLWQKTSLIFFCFTITLNLFFTHGRTGMVALVILTFVLIWQLNTHHKKKITLTALFFIPVVLSFLYYILPDFQIRIDEATKTLKQLYINQSGEGSAGNRLLSWILGIQIAIDNWIFGIGIGDFKETHLKYLSESLFTSTEGAKNHPLNQYLFVWATSGIFGLITLLAIFYTLLKMATSIKDQYQFIRIGFVICYLTIMMFDNYLFFPNNALLFILFTALFFREDFEKKLNSNNHRQSTV